MHQTVWPTKTVWYLLLNGSLLTPFGLHKMLLKTGAPNHPDEGPFYLFID